MSARPVDAPRTPGTAATSSPPDDDPRAPSHPSPSRFGLKSLMVIVAILGAQFALISMLGPLIGLAIGAAFCFLALTVLLLAAISLRDQHGTPLMDTLDAWAVRMVVGTTILLIAFVFAGGGVGAYYVLQRLSAQNTVQQDLGFTSESVIVLSSQAKPRARRMVQVVSVSPGGPFEKAGVRTGDVIETELAPHELFRWLNQQPGETVTLTLAVGAPEKTLDGCTKRQVQVQIPPE